MPIRYALIALLLAGCVRAQFEIPAPTLTLEPRGADPGDTGQVRWRELAANGQNAVTLKAPDDLAADVDLTWFDELPASTLVVCVDENGLLSTGCSEFELPNGGQISWADSGGDQRILLRSFNGEFQVGHVVAPATGGNTTIFSTVGTTSAGMMVEARDSDGVQVFRRVTGTAARAFLGDNTHPWEAYIGHGVNLLTGGGNVSQLLLEDHSGLGEYVYILGQKDGTGATYGLHLPLSEPATGQYLTVLGSPSTDVYELGWGSGGAGFYQTVQEAGTARTQRAAMNFLSPFTATDDGANTRTNIACPTCVTDATIGDPAVRYTSGWFQDAGMRTLLFRRIGESSHDFSIHNSAANILQFRDNAGGLIMEFDLPNNWIESAYNFIPNPTTRTLGLSTARWANVFSTGLDLRGQMSIRETSAGTEQMILRPGTSFPGVEIVNPSTGNVSMLWRKDVEQVYSRAIVPFATNTYSLGSASLLWANVHATDATVYTALLPDADQGANIGTGSAMFANAYARSLSLGRSGAVGGEIQMHHGSTAGTVTINTNNLSSTPDLQINALGTYPNQDGVQHLGWTSRRWGDIWGLRANLSSTLAVTGSATFASAATFNGGVSIPSGTNSTIFVGSSGNLYLREIGASSGVSCAAVADGWTALTSDHYLVRCLGGTRYRVALASY